MASLLDGSIIRSGEIKNSLLACVRVRTSNINVAPRVRLCMCMLMLIIAFSRTTSLSSSSFLEYISHLHIATLECRLLEAISSQPFSDG